MQHGDNKLNIAEKFASRTVARLYSRQKIRLNIAVVVTLTSNLRDESKSAKGAQSINRGVHLREIFVTFMLCWGWPVGQRYQLYLGNITANNSSYLYVWDGSLWAIPPKRETFVRRDLRVYAYLSPLFFFCSSSRSFLTDFSRDSLIDFVSRTTDALARDKLISLTKFLLSISAVLRIYDFDDEHDSGCQTYDAIIGGIYHLNRFDHAKARRFRLNAFDRLIVVRYLVKYSRSIIYIARTRYLNFFFQCVRVRSVWSKIASWYWLLKASAKNMNHISLRKPVDT